MRCCLRQVSRLHDSFVNIYIGSLTLFSCGGPPEKGFLGCSAVAAPFKGCIGRCKGANEEVKIVEIDLDVLKVGHSLHPADND